MNKFKVSKKLWCCKSYESKKRLWMCHRTSILLLFNCWALWPAGIQDSWSRNAVSALCYYRTFTLLCRRLALMWDDQKMTIKQDLTTVKSPARNQQYQSTVHCCSRKKLEVFSQGFNSFNSSTGIVLTPFTVVSKRKKAKPAFFPPIVFKSFWEL